MSPAVIQPIKLEKCIIAFAWIQPSLCSDVRSRKVGARNAFLTIIILVSAEIALEDSPANRKYLRHAQLALNIPHRVPQALGKLVDDLVGHEQGQFTTLFSFGLKYAHS